MLFCDLRSQPIQLPAFATSIVHPFEFVDVFRDTPAPDGCSDNRHNYRAAKLIERDGAVEATQANKLASKANK